MKPAAHTRQSPRGRALSQGSTGNDDTRNPTDHPATRQEAPEHRGEMRRFLVMACMAGWVGPERVVERILQELADEAGGLAP